MRPGEQAGVAASAVAAAPPPRPRRVAALNALLVLALLYTA